MKLTELEDLIIVCGHYGTGKTEFAVNLALFLREAGRRVAVADLDIVNPYFRSRERAELFMDNDVHLILSPTRLANADIPALPGEINRVFDDEGLCSVLDVGGDPVGARVLKRYVPRINAKPHSLIFVFNANRPQTDTAEKAYKSLRDIELMTELQFTHIVSNTHLCGLTTADDVVRGHELASELCGLCSLPLLCDTVYEGLYDEVSKRIDGELFPLRIYMKKPWE